jgi:hypothetical protein
VKSGIRYSDAWVKCSDDENMYEVKPEYFHMGADTIVFLNAESLTNFLNATAHQCEVSTYARD